MYVSLMNSGREEVDLRLPITVFLSDSRPIIANCPPRAREAAAARMRDAWEALGDTATWKAAVYCAEARAIARENPTIGQQEIEALDLCHAIREVYKKAPSGFEKVGRSAKQDE